MKNGSAESNVFQKHQKKTLVVFVLFLCFLMVGASELFLKNVMGLGDPVLYAPYPLYGFRPLPSKEYSRLWGSKIKFNNLALRAATDWDDHIENKILFLGDSVPYGGSYVDNSDLFSYLSVGSLGGDYVSGNAGVNAWGVENVYGLIVESNFIPASIYVTVFPEGDFYRGLVQLQGLPFFCRDTNYALEELWYYFCYRQNNGRYKTWQSVAGEEARNRVVEKAVRKLKEMDVFLREQGCEHVIFITPSKVQAIEGGEKDALLSAMLLKYELSANYIVDDLNESSLSRKRIKECYQDDIHLSKAGHEVWADIIACKLREILSCE
jgi:hypothetical protein